MNKSNFIYNKDFKSAVLSVLLVILLLLAVQVKSIALLSVFLIACLLLINKPIYLIPAYIISSLSSDYFIAANGLGISRLIGFVIILAGLLNLTKNRVKFNSSHLVFLFIIIVYTLFSSLFSLTGAIQPFISLFQNLIIIFFISTFFNVDIKLFSKILVISALLTIIALRIQLNQNLSDIYAARVSITEDVNENRFAMMLAQLIVISFFGFLIAFQSKSLKILTLAGVGMAIYMLILSGSRSATIGALGAILIVCLIHFRKKTYRFILPIIILTVSSYWFINYLQELNLAVLDRFSAQQVQETGGTGRFQIWEKLVPVTLEQRPIMGFGLGGENSYQLAYKNGLSHAAHNFLVDMFLQLGLLGVILFLSYYIFSLKKLFKKINNEYALLPLLLFFAGLLNGIGETVFLEKHFWNSIALIWLFTNNLSMHKRKSTFY